MPEDHVVLSFLELTLMCPQLLTTEQGFHKFRWRKNRRAEDWRPLPTGRDHAHRRVIFAFASRVGRTKVAAKERRQECLRH
jgi:hypothetical protein